MSDRVKEILKKRDQAGIWWSMTGEDWDALVSEIDRLTEELQGVREVLWLRHGHQGLYGDDGEMQCGVCGQLRNFAKGMWDYKHTDIVELTNFVMSVMNAEIADLKAIINKHDVEQDGEWLSYAEIFLTCADLQKKLAEAEAKYNTLFETHDRIK